jgi:hypothetical protein
MRTDVSQSQTNSLQFAGIFAGSNAGRAVSAADRGCNHGRTNAPAAKTSILMRPPVAAPIVCANRFVDFWHGLLLSTRA